MTDLIEHVGLSQPLVSWHIGRLRAAGLVATRRSGRETVCSLRPEAFDAEVARERSLLGFDHAGADKTAPVEGPLGLSARTSTADA